MRRILGLALLLTALMASQVWAQGRPKLAEVVTGVSVNQVFDFFLENDVKVSKVTSKSGTTYLSIDYDGWDMLYIDFFDCENDLCGSLLLSTGFTLAAPPTLEIINAFNYEYRFARVYLDGDEAWIESDLMLKGGIALKGLMLWLDEFVASVSNFADAIGYEK